MSEEYQIRNALDVLENHDLDVYTSRIPTYQNLERIIPDCNIDAETASRLLVECAKDLEVIERYKYALPVTAEIVKKIQAGQCPTTVNLLPSALGILNLLNMLSNTKNYKKSMGQSINLACNTFISYPNETLIAVAENNFQKIKDLFEHTHLNTMFFAMVHKILQIIPPEGIHDFVQSELQFWFMQLIPMSMNLMIQNEGPEVIKTLETLTETLVDIEYSQHPYWLNVLECISKPSRFPVIIKSLLEKGNHYWHRLWMVFIKLLKNQITKVCGSHGSPINSMLHAVECAFKMDPVNRCRAFECWNVLIDNFASETNTLVVQKRLKLLLIPLLSNNSKTEVLAIAKFETWWHLIHKFQMHVEKNADKMLISFLHFCFGKPSQQGNVQIPGQLSNKLKDLCVQAFITMFGHLDCAGCTTIPTLSIKLINTHLLTSYWEQWKYSLQKVMVLSLESDDVTLSIQRLLCVFKSLLVILGDLVDNNIRMDLVDYVIKIWIQYITDNIHKPNTSKIILDVVIPAITDERFKKLFKIKDDEQSRSVVYAILDSLVKVIKSINLEDFVYKVKPLVVLWISESKLSIECVGHLIKNYLSQENSWPMWTLVADAVFDCASQNDQTIITMLLKWPLHAQNLQNIMTSIADVEYMASIWTNLCSIQPKQNEIIFHDELFVLLQKNEMVNTAHYFVTKGLLYVLKKKFSITENPECEVKLLEIVLESINDIQLIEKVLPILVDLAVLMLNNLIEKEDKIFAVTVIKIVNSILKLIVKISEKPLQSNFTVSIQHLFVLVESFFKNDTNSEMKKYILNDLIFCHTKIPLELVEKKLTTSILKLFLSQSKDSDPEVYSKIKSALKLENTDNKSNTPKKFLTPEKKSQKRKKEPHIVNKVVENGEEYVVVKSNWKFNPKKLTENQKEKMKRKRVDIPALYQDLSQSQDEFRLSTWKTDSQDTTMSSKSSSKMSDNDNSSTLKAVPSSEVVPKIIENLISETKDSNVKEKTDLNIIKDLKIVNSPVPKPKTPRMALKDRVFKNVRKLMEKSSNHKHAMENNPSESAAVPSTENTILRTPNSRVTNMMNMVNSASASKAVSEKQQPHKSDENAKTPKSNQDNISSIVHSAPAMLLDERPSRIKRKPKKYDNLQVIDLKKSRKSTSLNNSPQQSDLQVENYSNPTMKVSKTNLEEFTPALKVIEDKTINHNASEVISNNVESQKFTDNNVSKELDAELNSSLNQSKSLLISNNAKLKEIEIENNEIKPVHTSPNKNQETICNCIENSKKSQNADASQSQDEFSQTPKANQNKGNSSIKKSSTKKKKTRIEHELAIDMVEGHQCLKTPEKRVRKKLTEIVTPRRNNTKKLVKTCTTTNTSSSEKGKRNKKSSSSPKEQRVTIKETQEKDKQNLSTEDVSCSEDVIESSQDSTITTLSIKSTKSPNRIPLVIVERHHKTNENTESLLDNFDNALIEHKSTRAKKNQDSFNDSVFPCNKTAVQDKTAEVTATMNTELIDDDFSDVQIISEDIAQPETINTENTCIDLNTEEIANADTQSLDPNILNIPNINVNNDNDATISLNTQNDATKTFNERLDDEDSVSSPCKDKSERKQDFLNNTLEISPIKILSPLREEKTPSPETSDDYVVIQLSSPVQSNGEPCEKCDSPEIFTEERVSPDKRDLSPPRDKITVSNLSPSSALSLKKNRPTVRSGGRAAQMLGLCVPDNEQSIKFQKPVESDESKKSTASTTPARRNLRIIYNSAADNTAESVDDSEDDSGNFLKLKKSLPPVDSSPSGPILKRKLADITDDDTTVTPVSKRKRVSFHDPPVSTTMSVIKYIEPGVSRSPSNSAQKRQDQQTRPYANMKSPKRLDNVFKLDTLLVKAVESFSDNETSITSTNDTEMSSIEETPVVEIVKISDLNDTDPICPDLVDCKDPISNIASELSSPSMSSLLTKELEGKVECIGDLAKLTELEVNRLCIKVPKVAIAKKVLADYLAKSAKEPKEINPIDETTNIDTDMPTNMIECNNSEEETNRIVTATASVQCEVCLASTSTQTVETGSKSIKDIINDLKENLSCLMDNLDDTTKLQIADTLPLDSILTLIVSKLNTTTSKQLLDSIIQKESARSNNTGNSELSFVEDYIRDKFQSKDLIMLCSNLLKKAYDKLF